MSNTSNPSWPYVTAVILGVLAAILTAWFVLSPAPKGHPVPVPLPVQTVDPNYHVTWDWDGIHCRNQVGHIANTSHCIMPTP